MTTYQEFLERKAIIDAPTGIADPQGISNSLFSFQGAVTRWALQRGRAAIFAGTGLGKTSMQCENTEPVEGEFDYYFGMDELPKGGRLSIDIWQRYASPVWMDINPSDTLQFRSARESNDERHICPLQLQVIERGLEMWSNPGDIVLSPFMGIGSEGYVSIERGRKFIGFELKESYYKQSVANLHIAEKKFNEISLFDDQE